MNTDALLGDGLNNDDNLYEANHTADGPDKKETPQPDTVIAEYRGTTTTVSGLEVVSTIPGYPKTHPFGYAYIIDYKTEPDLKSKLTATGHSTEYCTTRKFSIKNSRCLFLENVACDWIVTTCSGIRVCEYVKSCYVLQSHTEVPINYWGKWEEEQPPLSLFESDKRKINANSQYYAIRASFARGSACGKEITPSCKPIFVRNEGPNITGVPKVRVQCRHYHAQARGHFIRSFDPQGAIDIDHLETRLQTLAQPPREDCLVIEWVGLRRHLCGVDHIQGQGKMIKHPCNVQFTVYIPKNLTLKPRAILISHGIHNHVPPPPKKSRSASRSGSQSAS